MPDGGPFDSPASALKRNGLKPRKRLGQNFLQDRSVLHRIVSAAELDQQDEVLEIGPGTGILTEALAHRAKHVVAVELDESLHALVATMLEDREHVAVLRGNALDLDPCSHFSGPYKLVANIPYYITGPLVRHFLEAKCQPCLAVMLVQWEVAERMAAAPGQLSLLGVSVQYYARVKIVSRVAATSFYPRPKVDSALVLLQPYRQPAKEQAAQFFHVVRAGFSMPRKQIINCLTANLCASRSVSARLLLSAGVDQRRRAETLTLSEWDMLVDAWASERMVAL
ncbi:MAG: 16S rRNA (adenine(1518)-N(6)/adenine(1519)-N(6)) -dimethyltransferase RsmA [Chloroflexota bacterium]